MNTVDVINYFGSKPKVAKALKVSKQAIGKWGDTVPELRQFQLEVITNGELKSDFTSIKILKEGQQ
ncbi:Cro/CI family transcriptional regulator [Vibrio parahaemolyticus]|uniref:Cro/CI family transcriptional regulator n=1 Tax=Vibrio parahaemolyticus TaxID=670 RepID=UPI0011212E5C|nr:Cro/CI family transcriptional regulator [Vibrio parahaemolyticus]TPA69965.1 Cro/Cl family transcriptional regulator [Vibrio parahaemolyticus]